MDVVFKSVVFLWSVIGDQLLEAQLLEALRRVLENDARERKVIKHPW
ncbi:hypothetical protein [Massilia mucilaginosa]|nr:hypothetical protein [Massilia mucilaginosa]